MADMADLLVDYETGMLSEEECEALEDSGMLDGFEMLGAEVEARHHKSRPDRGPGARARRERRKRKKEGARHKAKA